MRQHTLALTMLIAASLASLLIVERIRTEAMLRPTVSASPQGLPWVAPAAEVIELDDAQQVVDLWPATRVLDDPDASMSALEASRRLKEFTPASSPKWTLGPRSHPVWLAVPVRVAAGDGKWIIDIDYPVLGRVDVAIIGQDHLEMVGVLGAAQPYDERPLHTRSHAMEIELPRGQIQTILLRVQTTSSMVVPLKLAKQRKHAEMENSTTLVQGAMVGVGLSMMAYAIIYAVALREPLYMIYALLVLSVTVFNADAFGVVQMLVKTERTPLMAMISPVTALGALIASIEFAMRALRLSSSSVRLARVLRGITLISAVVLVLSLTQVISYKHAQSIATILAPLGPLLMIWPSWKLAKSGDEVGGWMLFGWLAYLIGAFTVSGMLRGMLPASGPILHAYQIGSGLEVTAWLQILGVIATRTRAQVEQSRLEAVRQQFLAQTDALTGLPNRRGIQRAMHAALASCNELSRMAVFVGDLDGFKMVNDRMGHLAGDELLKQVAERLKTHVRHGDIVGRLGGDEFVILMESITSDTDVERIGHKLIEALDQPFVVNARACKLGLTLGYAMAPQHGMQADDLLCIADRAMYEGKRAGRARLTRGEACADLV